MPEGIGAFIAAAYILRYSMIGSEFISELGGETRDPGRNIPRVMVTSLVLVTLLYKTIAIIATGVLPLNWLPQSVAVRNRFGTPFILLTLFYIVGMLPIVTGMTLQYVTILGNAVGIIFGIIPVLALYNLYDRNPEAYRQATFRLPIIAMKIVPIAALAIYSFGVYLSLDFIGVNGIVTLLVYAAMLLAYAFWREPHVIISNRQATPQA